MKKIIIFFIAIIIILFSFKMPKLLFEAEDFAKEKEIYTREKVKSKIDVEAEKIYLVKAIHELYDNELISWAQTETKYSDLRNEETESKYKKVIFDERGEDVFKSSEEIQKINNEIKKLENINVLNQINFNDDTKYSIKYYGTNYSMFRNEKLIKSISIIFEDYDINIELENKTSKAIMLSFPKDKLKSDIDKKDILENYIKYLDLYIIDDWELNNQDIEANLKFDYLVSEKSQLLAMLMESDSEYIMSIQTINRYANLFEEAKRYNSYTK